MNKQTKYTANHKLSDLICDNYDLLLVISRFGIALGFGDQTVEEVCKKQGVEVNTFLAVVNFMENDNIEDCYQEEISIETLMAFLRRAHSYFLDYNLPTIRKKLEHTIGHAGNNVAFLIMKFYDDYVDEVKKHMEYENNIVFKYVSSLLAGESVRGYHIQLFEERHNRIADKLSDLKNIIIKYYPPAADNNQINSVLFDIFNCEKDLEIHCAVEDYLLVPSIRQFEERKNHGR